MGYSCTKAAMDTLNIIQETLLMNAAPNTANNEIPAINGFWEIGRENVDGSITGTVYKPCEDRPSYVRLAGSFRIEPNGNLTRFPGLSRDQKVVVRNRVAWKNRLDQKNY